MTKPAQVTKRPVTTEYDGNAYTGEQIVEGTKFLYQRVEFCGRKKVDSFRYRADQVEYMNGVAKQLLFELLRETTDA